MDKKTKKAKNKKVKILKQNKFLKIFSFLTGIALIVTIPILVTQNKQNIKSKNSQIKKVEDQKIQFKKDIKKVEDQKVKLQQDLTITKNIIFKKEIRYYITNWKGIPPAKALKITFNNGESNTYTEELNRFQKATILSKYKNIKSIKIQNNRNIWHVKWDNEENNGWHQEVVEVTND